MSETQGHDASVPVDVAICVDHDALTRLRSVIRHLCVGLVDHSARVRLITSSPEGASLESLGPVHVHVHPKLTWPMRRARANAIVQYLSTQPPTVLYGMACESFPLASMLAAKFDVELVLNVTSSRDVAALAAPSEYAHAHRIVSSETLLEALRAQEGHHEKNQTLIRPGVPRGDDRLCFSEENRIPSIVCTAPLEERFELEILIAAAQTIRNNGFSFWTFLVGEGSAEPALRRSVRLRRLEDRMTFARAVGDPIDVLRGADILVVAPGDEDISSRPLQAMANGTVVVGFEGGSGDYLRNGETGKVCQDRSATSLAKVIESLLTQTSEAQKLAAAARNFVREHHSISGMADRTMDVLRRITLRRQTFQIHRASH